MRPKTQDKDIFQFEKKLSKGMMMWGLFGFLSAGFIMTGSNLLARILDFFLRIFLFEWFWGEATVVLTICVITSIISVVSAGINGFFYYHLINILSNEPGVLSVKNHKILVIISKIHMLGQIVLNTLMLLNSLVMIIIKASTPFNQNYQNHYIFTDFRTSTIIFEVIILILGCILTIIWIIWNFYFKLWTTGIYNARKRETNHEFFSNLQIMMIVGAFLSLVSLISNSIIFYIAIVIMSFYLKPNEETTQESSNLPVSSDLKNSIVEETTTSSQNLQFCFNCGEKLDTTDTPENLYELNELNDLDKTIKQKCLHCNVLF